MKSNREELAARFRQLHHQERILILPNAWDAASARLFESADATAIGTTSGGVAATHGFPDGNFLPRELALSTLRAITRIVEIPVTADIEAGYGRTIDEVCATVRLIIDAGAVGINIEDGTEPPGVLIDKLRAIRALTEELGSTLFVNARTDVYLNGGKSEKDLIAESIRRARLYADAGADGVFVPGLTRPESIGRFRQATNIPLNVMALPGLSSPTELESLGVSRLSVGAGPMQAAMAVTRRIAIELLRKGTYESFLEGAIPNDEVNRMFAEAAR